MQISAWGLLFPSSSFLGNTPEILDFSALLWVIPVPSESPESRRSPADGGCPALSTRLPLSQPRKSSPGQSLQTLPVSLHLGNAQCSRSPPAYCPLLPSQLPAWSSGCSETPGEGSLWIFQSLPAASGNAADQGQPLW